MAADTVVRACFFASAGTAAGLEAPFGFEGGPPVNRSQLDASVTVALGGVTPAEVGVHVSLHVSLRYVFSYFSFCYACLCSNPQQNEKKKENVSLPVKLTVSLTGLR